MTTRPASKQPLPRLPLETSTYHTKSSYIVKIKPLLQSHPSPDHLTNKFKVTISTHLYPRTHPFIHAYPNHLYPPTHPSCPNRLQRAPGSNPTTCDLTSLPSPLKTNSPSSKSFSHSLPRYPAQLISSNLILCISIERLSKVSPISLPSPPSLESQASTSRHDHHPKAKAPTVDMLLPCPIQATELYTSFPLPHSHLLSLSIPKPASPATNLS